MTFVRCTAPSEVSPAVLAAIQACKDGQTGDTLVIQTADIAPYCDFVVLMKTDNGFKVVFVEATVSTLHKHASGKMQGGDKHSADQSTKRPRSRFTRAASSRASRGSLGAIHCSLEDIVALVARAKYNIKKVGSAVELNANTRSGASVSNAWLEILGAPCRLRVNPEKHGGEAVYHIIKESLSPGGGAAAGASEAEEQWDIAILYVSGTHLKQQCVKDLNKLRCDFAYCVFSEHLTVSPEKLFSRSNTPQKNTSGERNGTP